MKRAQLFLPILLFVIFANVVLLLFSVVTRTTEDDRSLTSFTFTIPSFTASHQHDLSSSLSSLQSTRPTPNSSRIGLHDNDNAEDTASGLNSSSNTNSASSSSTMISIQETGIQTRKRNRNRRKGLFVIHVGPPKTASTTINTRLLQLESELNLDGYTYQGRTPTDHPPINAGLRASCQRQLAQSKRQAFQQPQPQPWNPQIVPCWHRFVQRLHALEQQGRNIITSDEHYGSRWVTTGDGIDAPFDFEVFKQALGDQWDVLVTITYRRFSEWVVSAKQQLEYDHSWDKSRKCSMSFEEWIQPLLTSEGRTTIDFKRSLYYYQHVGPAFQAFQQQGYSVNVLNLQDHQTSILQVLLCDVLPNATHACAAQTQKEGSAEDVIANPSHANLFQYDLIACEAIQERNVVQLRTVQQKHQRNKQLVESLKHYHEVFLHSEPLPLKCASNTTLLRLWNVSMNMEQQFVPDFYKKEAGNTNQTTSTAAWREFWGDVSKNKYCALDMDAIFGNARWKEFFETYNNNTVPSSLFVV